MGAGAGTTSRIIQRAGLALLLLVFPLFASCQKENDNELLYLLGLLQPLGDYWARLYYVDPAVV
ncbi:MAG: hypothetical protein KDK25_08350, partial [Leptospiraceae bacterium]|nr:hypothetical protein [Leptospiraceae bacterium]